MTFSLKEKGVHGGAISKERRSAVYMKIWTEFEYIENLCLVLAQLPNGRKKGISNWRCISKLIIIDPMTSFSPTAADENFPWKRGPPINMGSIQLANELKWILREHPVLVCYLQQPFPPKFQPKRPWTNKWSLVSGMQKDKSKYTERDTYRVWQFGLNLLFMLSSSEPSTRSCELWKELMEARLSYMERAQLQSVRKSLENAGNREIPEIG